MAEVALDAERLAQLRVFEKREQREIAGGAVEAIAQQLERIDAALADDHDSSAAAAAHAARNEALLMGALELCDAFERLEHAARRGDRASVVAAVGDAHATWPPTREAIVDFAGQLDAV